jgi:hypothetical protein
LLLFGRRIHEQRLAVEKNLKIFFLQAAHGNFHQPQQQQPQQLLPGGLSLPIPAKVDGGSTAASLLTLPTVVPIEPEDPSVI